MNICKKENPARLYISLSLASFPDRVSQQGGEEGGKEGGREGGKGWRKGEKEREGDTIRCMIMSFP